MPLSGSASLGAEASSLNTVSAHKGVAWTKNVASAALVKSVRYGAIGETPEFNGGEPGLVDRTAGQNPSGPTRRGKRFPDIELAKSFAQAGASPAEVNDAQRRSKAIPPHSPIADASQCQKG